MSQGSRSFITPTGFQELKNSLAKLESEQVEVGKELKDAQEPGNTTENVSLEIARLRKANVEAHITQIRQTLRSVILIHKSSKANKVQLGSTVTLKSKRQTRKFTLVGSLEADPKRNYISDVSPVGQQLLGKKVGDKVPITNGETVNYRIKSIG